jgi:predicted MFS family arabinose efflux permease
LIADLGLDPADLGLLTSTYFISFAAFQLPLGVLLDRFGPRRVEAALLLFAALGSFIFARADTLFGLLAGRAFIGLGVSACLMAAFKAFTIWFPPARLPLINGLQMAAGGLGALSATAPIEWALNHTDWRGIFVAITGISLLVAIAIILIVPRKPPSSQSTSWKNETIGIIEVFTSPVFWRIAPWTTMSQATFMATQSLWAGPWLKDVEGLARGEVAEILLLMAGSMVAGFLFWGTLADRIRRRGLRPLVVAAFGMAAFMLCQTVVLLRLPIPAAILWAAYGLFGTTGILSYAELSQQFPPRLAGRVNTGLNLLVFVAAFAAQWGTGGIINLWSPTAAGVYPLRAYQTGLGLMLVLQLITFCWFALLSIILARRANARELSH